VRDEGGGVGGAVELCEEDGECVVLLEAGRMTLMMLESCCGVFFVDDLELRLRLSERSSVGRGRGGAVGSEGENEVDCLE
jgi:hypothetical protein